MDEMDSEMSSLLRKELNHMTTSEANVISSIAIWTFLYEGRLIVHFIKSFLHDKNEMVSSYFTMRTTEYQ